MCESSFKLYTVSIYTGKRPHANLKLREPVTRGKFQLFCLFCFSRSLSCRSPKGMPLYVVSRMDAGERLVFLSVGLVSSRTGWYVHNSFSQRFVLLSVLSFVNTLFCNDFLAIFISQVSPVGTAVGNNVIPVCNDKLRNLVDELQNWAIISFHSLKLWWFIMVSA